MAAICPNCKIQLPDSQLFNYYAAALDRDKSLAQPENRAKLDSQVEKEARLRAKLLEEARGRARIADELAMQERERVEKEQRERMKAEAALAQARRDEFFTANGPKLKKYSAAAVALVIIFVGSTSYFNSRKPIDTAPNSDGKIQPCIALGISSRDSNNMLNQTLENFRSGGISSSEIKNLDEKAKNIQAYLYGVTTGQANDLPEIEGSILMLSNSLGEYSKSLAGINTESQLIRVATDPIHELSVAAQKSCAAAGFAKQFNDASGWKE